MRSVPGIAALLAVLLGLPAGASADDCGPLDERIAGYERELKDALRDEPEDLPFSLRSWERARENGPQAKAQRIETKTREGLVALKAIEAPQDVARLHADMIDYYRAGVAFLDATEREDAAARQQAEIAVWLGLKRFMTNLRDLFTLHDCNADEVAAIEAEYLPKLDEAVARLRAGERPSDEF